MFDLFGIEKFKEYKIKSIEKDRELREMAYKTIQDCNDFMLKSGIISKADYWKSKLDLDLKYYEM